MKKIILYTLAICLLSSCDFYKGFKKGMQVGLQVANNANRIVNGFDPEIEEYLTSFERDTFILNDDTIEYTVSAFGQEKEVSIKPFLAVTFIKHGTLMLDIVGLGSKIIHVDPVSMFGTDYTKMPQADIILVTHEHGDHLDTAAIATITRKDDLYAPNTIIYSNQRVAEITGISKGLAVGDTIREDKYALNQFNIIPVLAYNTTEGRTQFHPKGRDLGYILEIERETNSFFRVYIAGDTEPIEEMNNLGDIDIAFLPVNQPYTMTAEQAIKAIETIKPKVVYPYHYGDTDLTPIVEHFKDNSDIEVRIRQMQ